MQKYQLHLTFYAHIAFAYKNKCIKKIFLHLDNDLVGQKAMENLKNNLKDKYEVIDGTPFQGKDWNDFLLLTLENIKKNMKER